MTLPPFNPNRSQPKPDPGLGDDVPCLACGAVALDTGLECSECGIDNYEAITGKPFGSAGTRGVEERPKWRCPSCGLSFVGEHECNDASGVQPTPTVQPKGGA